MSHERKKVLIAVIIISALVCLAACGYLVFRSFQMRQGAEEYSELQNSFYKQTDATVSADEAEDGLLPESELPVDFVSLMDVNPEVYAWITIPETKVNYPVLQSGDNGGLQSVFVQLELPPALAQNELFLLVSRDILRVAQQRVNLRPVLRDTGADIITVGTLRIHRQRSGLKPALYPGAEVFKHIPVTSVGVSQFGNLLGRGSQTCLCGIDGKAQPADGRHFQRRSEMICPAGRVQSRRRLLFCQTAHRNGPDGETGEVRVQLCDIDGACQPSAQNQDQKDQNDGQNDHEFFHIYHPQGNQDKAFYHVS